MKYVCSSDLVASPFDDGALLVDRRAGKSWSLNSAAATMWQHVANRCDTLAVANELASATGMRRERALREATVFVVMLSSFELAKVEESDQQPIPSSSQSARMPSLGVQRPAIVARKI